MKKVGNFTNNELGELTDIQIRKYIGSNKGLNNVHNKGKLDTTICIRTDCVNVMLPGSEMRGGIPPLRKLVDYIFDNFTNLRYDDKYWFSINKVHDWDITYFGGSSGELFQYFGDTGEFKVRENIYEFKGDIKILEKLFFSFIESMLVMRIPLKQIDIYPISNETIEKGYIDKKEEYYIGFREVVYDDIEPDNSSLEMMTGYEERKGEYVCVILI